MTAAHQIIKNDKIIRTSGNLRCMLDYARVSPVKTVATDRDPADQQRGVIYVEYQDGATCHGSFASYKVMLEFVGKRRSWRGAAVNHLGEK